MTARPYTLWFVPGFVPLHRTLSNAAALVIPHRSVDTIADSIAAHARTLLRTEETLVITTRRRDGTRRIVGGFFSAS
jgi:hypothetical protein